MTGEKLQSLRPLLTSAVAGTIAGEAMCELRRICQRIALIIIRKKITSGKLKPSLIGLTEEDIALDCIADLFARSPEGKFLEIAGYFTSEKIYIATTSEDLLFAHLRRLIFTTINDNLYRIYGELDPVLSRIIRNLKLAVKNSEYFALTPVFDEMYLSHPDGESDDGMPEIGLTELQTEVDESLLRNSGIPSLIERLAGCLGTQNAYRQRIPLTRLAYCVKLAYLKMGSQERLDGIDPDDRTIETDLVNIIRECCAALSLSMRKRYVANGKLTEGEAAAYGHAIRDILRREYLGTTDGRRTYYDHLRSALPELSPEKYSEQHRSIFEYLTILAKKEMKQRVKRM